MNLNKLKKSLADFHQIFGLIFPPNYGINIKNQELEDSKEENYIFGSIDDEEVIVPDGDWTPYLPAEEKQHGLFDSMNCTRFGLLNCIEAIMKAKFDIDVNYSDRYISQGVGRNGSTMQSALDNVRKLYGNVLESEWPVNWNTFNRSVYFRMPDSETIKKGKKWIDTYKLTFKYVNKTPAMMREALKTSPLYVSGYAWYKKNGEYISLRRPNHCFMVYKYGHAFDSYSPFIKKLSSNYNFGTVISIHIQKINEKEDIIENLKARGLKFILRAEKDGEIYEIKDNEIEYVSPNDWNKLNVKKQAKENTLVGITEDLYNKIK